MSENLNRVQLIGEIENAPEVNYMANKTEAIVFTLKTTEKFKRKDSEEWQELPLYHRCVSYNKRFAEMLKNEVKPHDDLFVEGKLKTRKYKDSSGAERYITEVVIGMFDGIISKLCVAKEAVYDLDSIPY